MCLYFPITSGRSSVSLITDSVATLAERKASKTLRKSKTSHQSTSTQSGTAGHSDDENLIEEEIHLKRGWNPPPGENIPTVFTALFHNGLYRPVASNSMQPIRFETDVFEGLVLFMVNTKTSQNVHRNRFEGVGLKYTFEIQVQGKFKRVPGGRLFVGAEITKRMELGLLTKGMCSTILSVGKQVLWLLRENRLLAECRIPA